MNFKDYFSQRHITVVGLGPHFEMVPEVVFMLREGARVTVVDPRSPAKLGSTLNTLQGLGLEKLVTGKFSKEDIHVGDIILIAPDVNPKDPYILEAEKLGIKVETVQTFLISLLPPVTIIGVMGTCGKSTVASLVLDMFKRSTAFLKEQAVFYIDPDTASTLPLLKKVKKGDVVIARIPQEHVSIYATSRIAPHVAVYTSIGDESIETLIRPQLTKSSIKLKSAQKDVCKQCGREGDCLHRSSGTFANGQLQNTSEGENNDKQVFTEGDSVDVREESSMIFDMFSILSLQTYNNFIVANDAVIDLIKEVTHDVIKTNGKMLRTGVNIIPSSWNLKISSVHEKENLSLAIRVAELFKIDENVCRKAAEAFVGLNGRMELVKKLGGLEFYNDSASVNALATLTALKSLSQNRNVVLIMGGAYKGNNAKTLIEHLPQYTETVILLPGSGTLRCHRELLCLQGVEVFHAGTIAEAVRIARDHARKFDRILFSPGFAVGGLEKSVAERGAAFVTQVKRFKK